MIIKEILEIIKKMMLFFLDIEYLLKEKKRYAITYLLDTEFEDYFYNRKVNVKFNVDSNHKVINYDKI